MNESQRARIHSQSQTTNQNMFFNIFSFNLMQVTYTVKKNYAKERFFLIYNTIFESAFYECMRRKTTSKTLDIRCTVVTALASTVIRTIVVMISLIHIFDGVL